VHRIAVGTAVTAGQHFTTGFKAIRQQDRRTLNSVNIGSSCRKLASVSAASFSSLRIRSWYMRIILQYEWNNLAVYRIAGSEKQHGYPGVLILCAAFAYNNVSKVVIIL
jgi:hypothetical protein